MLLATAKMISRVCTSLSGLSQWLLPAAGKKNKQPKNMGDNWSESIDGGSYPYQITPKTSDEDQEHNSKENE